MPERVKQRFSPDVNKYPDVLAVMISCEIRAEVREATIKQFTDLGIEVLAVLSPCAPASYTENCKVASIAVREAFREGKHALFLEDDLIVDKKTFPWFFEKAIEADEPTYLYLHDPEGRMVTFYGPELSDIIQTRSSMRRDLYRMRERRHAYGTQCVYLPYWFIEPIVQHDQIWRSQKSFDVALWQYMDRPSVNQYPLVALPHPIQHLHVRQGRAASKRGAVKKSMSFGMPWFESGPNVQVDRKPIIHFWAQDIEDYEHMRPIWRALNPMLRGYFMGSSHVMEYNGYELLVYYARSDYEGTTFYMGTKPLRAPGKTVRITEDVFEKLGVPRLDAAPDGGDLLEKGVVWTKASSINLFRSEIRTLKPDLSTARGALYSLARPHFLKYGLKFSESVYDVLTLCETIYTDNAFVAREAMTLGRSVVMIDGDAPEVGFALPGNSSRRIAKWIEEKVNVQA